LLLEGEWLSNEEGFDSIRKCVIERYVKGTPKDHQLALFLLNDIIRYWRTIAVDFAFKTTEGDSPKPWAIRNIKLVFSRKLMYAGGLFAVGMTVDRTEESKVKILEDLFRMPVIERMKYLCGPNRISKALASYDFFLRAMEDDAVRNHLKKLTLEGRYDPLFRDLKNEAHRFTRELLGAFERTFHSTHPIRRAVIF